MSKKVETKTETKRIKGHFGIVKGSRKEEVSIALAKKGRTYAIDRGKALGLAEGTLKSWIGGWIRSKLWSDSEIVKKRSQARISKKVAASSAKLRAKGSEMRDAEAAESKSQAA